MLKEFKKPSKKYKALPFWSWNDKLNNDELEEQIAEMNQQGLGGYFMHARSGLKTEYLSDGWFSCIETGINKAREFGMEAWAYDEEGWPSGFAGGIIPKLSTDYQAKFMIMNYEVSLNEVNTDNLLAVYLYKNTSKEYYRLEEQYDYICRNDEKLIIVKKCINPHYIDTMNEDAVKAFLKHTYEQYYTKFGEYFGDVLKGFFTDEPRLSCNNFGDLAWSDCLPDAFSKKYGYSILDHLPALFLKTKDYEKYRYDFWVMVNELFVQSYMKTIYDWCEIHNCSLTGHVMMEESIFSQMTSTAGVMPFYEYMHMPGIDWLRRCISSPVIAKQVGSVACQLGKKHVLSESFALSGWDVSFEELKWIAEWQFVNGVNRICQHLESYTIKGARKRDYPPSLFIQQTWWGEYKKFNDYLGRMAVALGNGKQEANLLLFHPLRSGYIAYDGTRTDEIRNLDNKLTKVCEKLSGNHISYHLGDETIIDKYSSIKNGEFIVGEMAYKTVVLPEMYSLDSKTAKLLLEFIEQGGLVLSIAEFPVFINGNKEMLALLKSKAVNTTLDNLRKLLLEKRLVTLSVSQKGIETKSIHYQQRETDEGTIFFFVNLNQDERYETEINIYNKTAEVLLMNAEIGEVIPIDYINEDGNTSFSLPFEPMQSYLILLKDHEVEKCINTESAKEEHVSCQGKWDIEEMELNSLTLDQCYYRVDNGPLKGPVSVIKLQEILLDLQRKCKIEMIFNFEVEMDLEKNKEFYTVIEEASLYEIEINGTLIPAKIEGYWKDKSFKKVNIKPWVMEGTNQIKLITTFKQSQKVYDVLYGDNVYETELNKLTYDMEIESIYLLGDFAVFSEGSFDRMERNAMFTDGPFIIVDQPEQFQNGDFTTNGLLFFAGQLWVSKTINVDKVDNKRIILDLGEQHAPLIKVYVNGNFVKDSMWAPYEIDITNYVVDGENKLLLQFFSSNRNLLGPHHHIDGECYNVGPDSFTGKWSWVERKTEADATDISDRDKNYWTDRYCFVEFGLK